MICEWDACHKKTDDNQTLGAHIYHGHIEPQPKDQGAFTCKWRGCNSRSVFKYRSHLALHLNDHLNGNLSNETELGSGWSYTEANTIVCDLSERLACPEKSCKMVLRPGSIPGHMREIHHVHDLFYRVRCNNCDVLVSLNHVSEHQKKCNK